jgi:putative transposase
VPTGRVVGIDMGLHVYCMDSDGQAIANPRFIHHVEHQVRRRSQSLSRKSLHHKQGKQPKQNHAACQRAKHNKYPPVASLAPRATPHHAVPAPPTPRRRQSANWQRARQALAKTYLTLQRQREDFARKQASALVSWHDLIALENLQIRNLVKNRRLAKAISDASWARVRAWVEYYGRVQQVPVLAVPPHYTSQKCSGCAKLVYKSLSVRTPVCPHCGLILDRDHNAALRIREAGLAQASEQGIWDPVRQGSRQPRPVHERDSGSGCGTVGHTET